MRSLIGLPRLPRRGRQTIALALLPLQLLVALPAAARSDGAAAKVSGGGDLAVVNVSVGGVGHELAGRAARELGGLGGGWACQPGVASLLVGRPSPGALPVGDTGLDLVRLMERVRGGRRPEPADLAALGKLLGVDYLLLLRVRGAARPEGFNARLFSTHRRAYAPQELHGRADQVGLLRAYVADQTRPAAEPPRKPGLLAGKSWWIWAVAAGLAALTIGLAVSASDDSAGDLRIRVSR